MELTLSQEIDRRRTFAIISHPDAGKTTITEKLIYLGGLIREAGEVKGKQGTKSATSDWMTMEKERGISVTSSVMQFDFDQKRVNLLDTPGHKDFSEDTYRTLVAADSALMLIDVAKGVEERTKKLYEVCRYRKIPIFTFINKCDRDGKEPLALFDEIEQTLQMKCFPINWPLGFGDLFRGVYHRLEKQVYIYNKADDTFAVIPVESMDDPRWKDWIHPDLLESVLEEIELLDLENESFNVDQFLAGEISPAFFGSAKLNFGVDHFLRQFVQWAPGPSQRPIEGGVLDPHQESLTGFIFKIQANMDKRHRDRMAFMRICSGKFERGMKVKHGRLGREIRLSHSSQFLAQERATVEAAYAGDIVGVSDPGLFRIGDSISAGKKVVFEKIPQFSPELFCKLTVKDALKRQKLQKGLKELSEEGVIQMFIEPAIGIQDPIIGVVGELQFEVLIFRLQDEYNLETRLLRQPYTVARWPRGVDGEPVADIKGASTVFRDAEDRPVILAGNEWDLNWLVKENPEVTFGSPFSDGMKEWL